jgi:hypothetical protein
MGYKRVVREKIVHYRFYHSRFQEDIGDAVRSPTVCGFLLLGESHIVLLWPRPGF